MNQFFKFVFASCLGLFLGMVALFGLGFLIIASFSGSSDKVEVKSGSVLEINFEDQIPEKTNNIERDPFQLNNKIIGLTELTEVLQHAKEDKKIKGIVIKTQAINAGPASASIIRRALLDFKKSGKFIIAFADSYTQGAYYLASTADKIILNPSGEIDFRGFASIIPFVKDMLDKIGVKPQVYYAGQFKSATETYRLNQMSDQNRLQTREYINKLYDIFIEDISKSRNIPVATLQEIANEYKLRNASDALRYKMVDALGYQDLLDDELHQRLKLKAKDKIPTVTLADYSLSFLRKKNYKAKDKIAVVYAEGVINYSEDEQSGTITQEKYAKIISDLRKDETVKSIVLRVNSPGGSSLTSDIIWRELMLAKKSGKKVIVSMGNYAASGGYYISCMADTIFAEPNTITGSIGVFAVITSFQTTLNDKFGIHFDTVKTGRYGAMFVPFYDINKDEGTILQELVDSTYEQFLSKVSEGRHLSRDSVHAIAQGRVWTGAKAKELGLVDRIGNLDDAIACAARASKLKEYRIEEYPKTKDPITVLIEKFTGKKQSREEMIKQEMGELYPYYQMLKEMKDMKGVQMRLPFMVQLN